MLFFEIDERGCIHQLSVFAGATAPCRGDVVYATDRQNASELYFRYRNGERNLKQKTLVPGYESPVSVICENKN